MKLDVLGMEAFVSVATLRSFARAADALSVTSPALTRRLNNLESQLGVQLLERTTRSVALTAAGASFLPRARHLLDELSTTFREISASGQAQRGTVTIACVPTVGVQFLPSVLHEYSRRHPDNRIRILDHTSYGVSEAVQQREAEFGINMADVQFSDLDSTPFLSDRFGLICRQDHPLARKRKLQWGQLEGHALIVPGGGSSNRPLLDTVLGPLNIHLPATYEVQRSATAVGLVAQGLGAAIVPQLSIQPGAYPQLRLVALVEPIVERTFVLLRRRGAVLSPAAQALHDLILTRAPAGATVRTVT
ncbi:MAG: LysR family transcriptional regulator YbhD [Ramlibacter sp.]|jgi:DNA-binding transcriptional LysR family regulator|nr:LysR family transcriptional regulator YbhD [Ramlibacter sp.]